MRYLLAAAFLILAGPAWAQGSLSKCASFPTYWGCYPTSTTFDRSAVVPLAQADSARSASIAAILSKLLAADVTAALGFAPYSTANPAGFIAPGGDGSAVMARMTGAPNYRSLAAILSERVSILAFGAVCDGATDDGPAIQAAIRYAALSMTGAYVDVPNGGCVMASAVTASIGAGRHVHLRGVGGGAGLVSPTGNGIAITLADPTAGFDASDLSITRSGSGEAGTALQVQATAIQYRTISHFRNLTFTGTAGLPGGGTAAWSVGLRLISLSAPVIEGVRTLAKDGLGSGTAVGVALSGSDTSHYLTDAKISNSLFQGGKAGVTVSGAVQGIYVTNTEAIGSDYGIYAEDADSGGANLIEMVLASNNHFNNAIAGIYLHRVHQNQITNNLFLHFSPAAGRLYAAILADTSGWNLVHGNSLIGQVAIGAGAGGENFYKTAGTSAYHVVDGNHMLSLAGYCVDTQSASYAVVSGNLCLNATAPGLALGATSFASANMVNGIFYLAGPNGMAASLAGPLAFDTAPTLPTAAADTSSTAAATTAFVLGQAAGVAPLVNGVATAGASTRFARADHVHPTDATRAPIASPSFAGLVSVSAALPNAAGSALADAAPLTTQVTYIQNVASGSGVALPAISTLPAGKGTSLVIFNGDGANDARVYAQSGNSIVGGGGNSSFGVAVHLKALTCTWPGLGAGWACY